PELEEGAPAGDVEAGGRCGRVDGQALVQDQVHAQRGRVDRDLEAVPGGQRAVDQGADVPAVIVVGLREGRVGPVEGAAAGDRRVAGKGVGHEAVEPGAGGALAADADERIRPVIDGFESDPRVDVAVDQRGLDAGHAGDGVDGGDDLGQRLARG